MKNITVKNLQFLFIIILCNLSSMDYFFEQNNNDKYFLRKARLVP